MTAKEYNQTVDEYSDRLYRYVLKMMKDTDASMDVVQDTFEKLWKNREKIEFMKAGSWLFKTSYNAIIDIKRKEYREQHPEVMPDRGAESGYSDLKEILKQALERGTGKNHHVQSPGCVKRVHRSCGRFNLKK